MAAGFFNAEIFKSSSSGLATRAIRHEFEDCEDISEPIVEILGGHSLRQETWEIGKPNIVPFEYCETCITRIKENYHGKLPT